MNTHNTKRCDYCFNHKYVIKHFFFVTLLNNFAIQTS